MSKTLISDLIVPNVFERYLIERTAQLSAFADSGIVESDAMYDELASGGGQTVNMPFFQDITASRQVMSGAGSLNVNKITASQDIARIQNDAQVWSVNLLSRWLSGEDPMAAIANLVAGYWARVDESLLISSMKGIFASASMSGNVLNIASESIVGASNSTKLTGLTFIDAIQKLGDRGDRLTSIVMHSAVESSLRKQDLIDFIPHSEGTQMLRTFQGRRVVVDDTLASRAGTTDGLVYTSYLFGDGVFARGHANLSSKPLQGGFGTEGVELARVALDSDDVMINRRRFLLHPRGVKFTSSSVAGDSPTNTELENGANWSRVWEAKNVRMVAITHNI